MYLWALKKRTSVTGSSRATSEVDTTPGIADKARANSEMLKIQEESDD